MISITERQAACILLSALMVVAPCLGQEQAKPAKGEAPVKLHVDLKRAQKAAEQGDQADAAGHVDEALLHYQEAVYYAPNEMTYALREAALKLLHDGKHTHPYYWAPFVLVGDWN